MAQHGISTVQAGTTIHRWWIRWFAVGLLLRVASVVVTLITGNLNLIPTVILLGSFLVPVTFVSWVFERWRDQHITTERIVNAFVAGGVLGVLGASLLETYLLHPSPLLFLGVGLIEEAVKLGALILVSQGMTRRHARDGFVLGATVGFGFAAFESAGYALNALLTVHGLSLRALVETELLRGVVAPVGHGLWTAILGGVLFREAHRGVFRYTRLLVTTYLWVAVLHALWDSMPSIAAAVTYVLTGSAWQYRLMNLGYVPRPTAWQNELYTLISNGGLVLVSLLGLLTLLISARRAGRHGSWPARGR